MVSVCGSSPRDACRAGARPPGSPRGASTVEVLPAPLGPRTTSTSPASATRSRPVDGRRGARRAVADGEAAGPRRLAWRRRLLSVQMIDIRLLRDEPDAVKAALARRGVEASRSERPPRGRCGPPGVGVNAAESKRAEVEELSRQVGQAKRAGDDGPGGRDSVRAGSRRLGEEERAAAAEADALGGNRSAPGCSTCPTFRPRKRRRCG